MPSRFPSVLTQLIRLARQPPSPGLLRPYPGLRNLILDILAEGRRKNTINLVFEADITPIRSFLAERAAQHGEHISLTAYIAKSLAGAVAEDKSIHAYRHGKSELVLFEEIDLSIAVEREIEGGTLPVIWIVRSAGDKSLAEIDRELQAARIAPLGEYGPLSALEQRFFELPSVVRRLGWFFIRRNPYLFKRLAGTVGITSMGMHTTGSAVVIPITPMTLTLSIGATDKKLVLSNGIPVEREIIRMNLSADHDIIDGAPLMRFVDRFRKKLDAGCAP